MACAVAIEFLRALDELLGQVRAIGGYFHEQLDRLKTRHSCIREVRGMGLMLAVELESADTAKAVVSALLENRIVINRTHETVLRFLPPYIIREKHVDEVIRALDSALSSSASKRQRPATPARAEKPATRSRNE